MLQLTIKAEERWDERTNEFVTVGKTQTIQLEHSLVSLSKWESKWRKPFFAKVEKTYEETLDYIKCMTITQNVNPDVYTHLTREHFIQIDEYIEAPMTATTIYHEQGLKQNKETVTSELIYYWMIALNIPFECRKWHLNQLMTLIDVCNVKNTPPKKMSKEEIMRRNTRLNNARRKKYNTKG